MKQMTLKRQGFSLAGFLPSPPGADSSNLLMCPYASISFTKIRQMNFARVSFLSPSTLTSLLHISQASVAFLEFGYRKGD